MKSMMLAAAVAAALALAGPANAQEALAKSAGCMKCHAMDRDKDGPSFQSIAAKYKGQADAEAKLLAKIQKGDAAKGEHDHPTLKTSADDEKALIKWVLSL